MKKALFIAVGAVFAAAVLFFFVGPYTTLWLKRQVTHINKPTMKAPISIKANGTVSLIENYAVLTTPQGLNNYILVGGQEKELKALAGKKQTLFVFGTLMIPDPKTVGDKKIRYNIDVQHFDSKEFQVGKTPSTMQLTSIKKKIDEKAGFRNSTLQKLGMNKSTSDVLSGKLVVIQEAIYPGNSKEHAALTLTDKYGDDYILYDRGAMNKPYSRYLAFKGQDLPVVVIGDVTLPDPALVVPGSTRYIPFNAVKIFNADLTPLIAPEEKGKQQ